MFECFNCIVLFFIENIVCFRSGKEEMIPLTAITSVTVGTLLLVIFLTYLWRKRWKIICNTHCRKGKYVYYVIAFPINFLYITQYESGTVKDVLAYLR